jgi:hypothetical protein
VTVESHLPLLAASMPVSTLTPEPPERDRPVGDAAGEDGAPEAVELPESSGLPQASELPSDPAEPSKDARASGAPDANPYAPKCAPSASRQSVPDFGLSDDGVSSHEFLGQNVYSAMGDVCAALTLALREHQSVSDHRLLGQLLFSTSLPRQLDVTCAAWMMLNALVQDVARESGCQPAQVVAELGLRAARRLNGLPLHPSGGVC